LPLFVTDPYRQYDYNTANTAQYKPPTTIGFFDTILQDPCRKSSPTASNLDHNIHNNNTSATTSTKNPKMLPLILVMLLAYAALYIFT
jgi:hypothetical protein